MPKGYKIAVWVVCIVVAYLAYRDYDRAVWLRQELFVDWIQANNFQYAPVLIDTPADPTKPPPPPPPFGF